MIGEAHRIEGLIALACALGASAAVIVPGTAVVVEDRFAALCGSPHRCPSYGLAPGCPPHAMKPEVFREQLRHYPQVLVFKIDVPVAELLGEGRLEVARKIHRIAAGVEQEAIRRGLSSARGIAAGSCKELFCGQREDCAVLTMNLPCPHAGQARPSLSALGVNFTLLAESIGWQFGKIEGEQSLTNEPAMGLMAGMVLLG